MSRSQFLFFPIISANGLSASQSQLLTVSTQAVTHPYHISYLEPSHSNPRNEEILSRKRDPLALKSWGHLDTLAMPLSGRYSCSHVAGSNRAYASRRVSHWIGGAGYVLRL